MEIVNKGHFNFIAVHAAMRYLLKRKVIKVEECDQYYTIYNLASYAYTVLEKDDNGTKV